MNKIIISVVMVFIIYLFYTMNTQVQENYRFYHKGLKPLPHNIPVIQAVHKSRDRILNVMTGDPFPVTKEDMEKWKRIMTLQILDEVRLKPNNLPYE
jgi:hypothetical protein